MHFKLVYGNHWNFGLQVSDTFRYLKLALESAGHRADIEKQVVPGFINVFQECFDDDYCQSLLAAHEEGLEFILIATEFLTGHSFNNFDHSSDEGSYYSKADYWAKRYQNFRILSQHALCIWHLCEQEVEGYQRAFAETQVGYLPHAYVDGFRSVCMRSDTEQDIDFLFTGTLTAYRMSLLEELEKKGFQVAYTHALTAPFHRDDLVSRAKICLNLKQYERWRYPSPSRYFFHVSNQSYLVSESCEFVCDIQRYVDTCKESSFIDYCEAILRQGSLSAITKKRLEEFSDTTSARSSVKELIEMTL